MISPLALTPTARPHPAKSITISVSAADKARHPYLDIPFEVPQGMTRIAIRLGYAKSETCVIDLGLGDPTLEPFPSSTGLRGWSGGARSEICVGVDAATPGYVPGPIQTGVWKVILGLYRIPDDPVEVSVEIWFSSEARGAYAAPEPAKIRRRQPGWYKGDLQCHTFHSDAKGSPEQLHATAVREGLDFLAVTEHNTLTSYERYFSTATSEDLLVIPAYEFTTEFGHANVFGAKELFDFRIADNADVVTMVERIRASGALFSPNHDKPVIPFDYDVPAIDCMEVWQSHWLAGNFISLAKYQARLARGERVTAIGASDFHQPQIEPAGNPFTLARPCTFLWLEELSVDGVLDAMRKGRSFVTESPNGPRLTIQAGDTPLGGSVDADRIELTVAVTGAQGDEIALIDVSGVFRTIEIESNNFQTTVAVERPSLFVRAELIAKASHAIIVQDLLDYLGDARPGHSQWDDAPNHPIRRALTSPIYIG